MTSNTKSKVKNPTISIVFSFFNEREVLPELLSRMRKVLRSRDDIGSYELIFVNDASSDDSEHYLRQQIESEGDIVLLNTSRNFGVSECVYAGLQAAKGDAVIYMDADLQDPPEVVGQMLDMYFSDPEVEVVYTTRIKRHGENWLKMQFTKLGYRLISALSHIDLPADSGDFKLMSRRVVDLLLAHEERLPYIRGLVSYYGFKQAQLHYERDPRFDGRQGSKFPLFSRRVIYYHFDRALISFSDAPLKLGLLLGFMTAGFAGIYIVVVVIQKILGLYEPGWPSLMATMLALGAAQLVLTGFLGLYINSIFLEIKRRPNYVIKDVVRPDSKTNVDEKSPTDES